jgi:hypothetical protein
MTTNHMELSLSWEAEFSNIIWNSQVYCYLHKSPLLAPSWARSKESKFRPWITFRNELLFLRLGVVILTPYTTGWGPPVVSCPRLLIQY